MADVYGKTFTVTRDTVFNILDFSGNIMGSGEGRTYTRIVNTQNGKYSIRIAIPSEVVDCDPGTNCKKLSDSQFTIVEPGYFSLGYSYRGERILVFGHLNYECELLLDGQSAPDTIFIYADEDLERQVGVPDRIFKNCWWLFDKFVEENLLPYTSNKVALKDLLGDHKERIIILQTNDGSTNRDENAEPLGYSRDSLVIIDQRVPNAISSISQDEVVITPTAEGCMIRGAKRGERLRLYTLSGQLVWSRRVSNSALPIEIVGIPTGTYLVKTNQRTFKISL